MISIMNVEIERKLQELWPEADEILLLALRHLCNRLGFKIFIGDKPIDEVFSKDLESLRSQPLRLEGDTPEYEKVGVKLLTLIERLTEDSVNMVNQIQLLAKVERVWFNSEKRIPNYRFSILFLDKLPTELLEAGLEFLNALYDAEEDFALSEDKCPRNLLPYWPEL